MISLFGILLSQILVSQGSVAEISPLGSMNTAVEVIHCPDAPEGDPKAILLATHEFETYGYSTTAPAGKTALEKFDKAISDILTLSPTLHERLKLAENRAFISQIRYVENNLFNPITAEDFTIIPMGCTLRQLSVHKDDNYFTSEDLWDELSEEDKARAWMQLAIKRSVHDYGGYDQRLLAMTLASDNIKENLLHLNDRNYESTGMLRFKMDYVPGLTMEYAVSWVAVGPWHFETNLGMLHTQLWLPLTIKNGKLSTIGRQIDYEDYPSDEMGKFVLQSQIFQIFASHDRGPVNVEFYPTGEVCGFQIFKRTTVLDENNYPLVVEPGDFLRISKSKVPLANQADTESCLDN